MEYSLDGVLRDKQETRPFLADSEDFEVRGLAETKEGRGEAQLSPTARLDYSALFLNSNLTE